MKNNRIFNKNNKGRLLVALIALVLPIGALIYMMNEYEYSPVDARTESFTSDIEILPNGDVNFKESRVRFLNYRVIEQSLYFTADDEDVSNSVHTPQFDTANFANRVYDMDDNLLIEGDGTAPVTINEGVNQRYLTYSWLPGAVNEQGYPFVAEDDESINLLHYNSDMWGRARFEYDYTIKGVALEYADTSEFFWTVAATDYMRTSNVAINITLPGINYDVSDVDVYAFGANKVKVIDVSKQDDGRIVVGLEASRLYPNEFIVTRINFPTSALAIPDNTYGNIVDSVTHLPNVAKYQNEYEMPRTLYTIADIVGYVVVATLFVYAIIIALKIYKKYDKEHTSSFYGEYYRELPNEYPPAMMGYLYRFKEITKDDVSATLMDLLRRGYVQIDASGQSLTAKRANYTLRYVREKDQSELKEYEKQLLKWFFDIVAEGDTLSLEQLENYGKTEARATKYMNANHEFNRLASGEGRQMKFFDDVKEAKDKGKPSTMLLLIIGIILIVIRMIGYGTFTMIGGGILISMSIILGAYFSSIERRSQQGHEDYVRWRAFEKFLKEFSKIKDYSMPGIVVWEHYMVYATSFGIADLVEKQLRYKYKQLNQEVELERSYFFRYPGLHYMYWRSVNRSVMRAQQTIQVAQQQRNSARGGGGRFGGGGGISFGGGGSGVSLR